MNQLFNSKNNFTSSNQIVNNNQSQILKSEFIKDLTDYSKNSIDLYYN